MTTQQPKTHKSTKPSARRWYAEYHYEEPTRHDDPLTPWGAAVGEYTETQTTHRANGDDE